MFDVKKTTKIDLKIKDIIIKDGTVIDFESGEVVDLIEALSQTYNDSPFTLSCTTKEEEILEIDSNAIE